MKNKLRLAAIIVIAIGLLLSALGIFKIISANNMTIPSISDDNWFALSSKQTRQKDKGTVLCVVGFFTAVGIGSFLMIMSNKDKIEKKDDKQETIESKSNDDTLCKFCCAPLEGNNKCSYCGNTQ